MAEEQVQHNANEQAESTPDVSTALQNFAFGEDAPIQQPTEQVEQPQEAIQPTETTEEEQVFDEADYLKELGFDSKDALKNEIETLRGNKPFEWKNDDSRRIAEYINEGKEDELFNFLNTKKAIEKLSKAEIVNKNIAAELVKFGIQKDNPSLTPEDVDFLFNQQYSVPEKPIQDGIEDDSDYENRVRVWEAQVANVERRMIIEAKMQQPKLAQLQKELVLPNIQIEGQQQQPSQEDLQARQQLRDNLLQTARQELDKFSGFGVQVKDKDVNYSVGYNPSQEEKAIVSKAFERFSDSDFNANAIFANRWLNADGKSFNVNQIKDDLLRIYCGSKIDQKLAIDSAGKRMEEYIKAKKQVSIAEPSKDSTFTPTNKGASMEQLWQSAFG